MDEDDDGGNRERDGELRNEDDDQEMESDADADQLGGGVGAGQEDDDDAADDDEEEEEEEDDDEEEEAEAATSSGARSSSGGGRTLTQHPLSYPIEDYVHPSSTSVHDLKTTFSWNGMLQEKKDIVAAPVQAFKHVRSSRCIGQTIDVMNLIYLIRPPCPPSGTTSSWA
jgi:hypothetical protein